MTPDAAIPAWLAGAALPGVLSAQEWVTQDRNIRQMFADQETRQAAVLVLFSGDARGDSQAPGGLPGDAEVLLTQRAATMRQHRGQVAFPGGAIDPQDAGPIAAALREASEEAAVDPGGVIPVAAGPPWFVPPSRFDVTPVIGYWQRPNAVRVVDPAETERVVRVPMRAVLDPANRFRVRTRSGFDTPAFVVDGMLVWGLTAGILAALIGSLGWELPWDRGDIRDLEESLAALGMSL